jgi:endonuclease/exonuclease/phosphatase family metal-dependent hydrolase
LREARDVTPQQAWQQDIIKSIQVLQAQKVEVVIVRDFNTTEITRGSIKEICTQCNLEVISHASNGFSSYKQGTKCIDHILGSVIIAQAVTLMRFEDYPAEYYSDHTPMFLQINLDILRSSYGIGNLPRK